MKNFYEKGEFKFLDELTSTLFVDAAASDYAKFLDNMSALQLRKFSLFTTSLFVSYFIVFLKFIKEKTTTPPYELYNIHCADFNISERNYKHHPIDLEIEQINKFSETGNGDIFKPTLTMVEGLSVPIVTCGYIHYKENAKISAHAHDEGYTVFHLLLEDIEDEGSLNVKINNETKQLKSKGDFLMFDPFTLHEAWLIGKEAKTISLGLLKNTYEHC